MTENDLGGRSLAVAQDRILHDVVSDAADLRLDNASLRRLVNFGYKDGARTQTSGWLIESPGLTKTINECGFETIDFVDSAQRGQATEISVPVLTRREVAHLNQLMPVDPENPPQIDWLDHDDLESYAQYYKWYPEAVLVSG